MTDMPGKEPRRDGDGDAASRLRRRATYASVAVALTLIVSKLVAYLLTGSVSLLSSLIDSTTDLLASLVTLFGVNQALKPPDQAHRFGHGKAEALAALTQSAFIVGSAGFLVIEAINRLLKPQPVESGLIGIGVMVLSIVLTMMLTTYQRHVIGRTGSVAIDADRLHYSGDLLMNSAVIAALVLTWITGITVIDGLFALAIAVFLLYGAWGIAVGAFDVLMDRELPTEERRRICGIVTGHDATRGLHDLRTRNAGTGVFIELHLELDSQLTLAEAHAITDDVERRLKTAFPGAEVIIHQEPAGLNDERLDYRIAEARRRRA